MMVITDQGCLDGSLKHREFILQVEHSISIVCREFVWLSDTEYPFTCFNRAKYEILVRIMGNMDEGSIVAGSDHPLEP